VNRKVHLILENENNQSRYLEQEASARPRRFTAQWNDDIHHVLHTAVTGEREGYYADYTGDTEKLGRALAEGFAFQGEIMPYRGDKRGQPSAHLPPTAFIAFLQNHDQIGNRAFGERISVLTTAAAVCAAAAVYLLMPEIPMLFMGEEWNATEPFPFFCDFGPDLADAVREGRREEFSKFPEFQNPERRNHIPDPQAESTFEAAKLRWNTKGASQVEWRKWYQRILTARREHVIPLIPKITHGGEYQVVAASAVAVRWRAGDEELTLSANLSAAIVHGFAPGFSTDDRHIIWQEGEIGDDGTFGPWTVRWRIS
ncbi:MAG TPA: DUF3459 domain-containing protein, partial [Bryobacteraceae bacterium]|nr:DUF3459 domain-containing protein [Bryobacteraceae bacterium]